MVLATGSIAIPAIEPGDLGHRPPTAKPAPRRRPPVALLAAAVAVLAALALGGLRAAGVEWLVVTTPSMGTAVPVGSLVIDVPVGGHAIRVGDVITFLPPGGGTVSHTHRVVAVGPAGFTTRGDANGSADPWVVHRAQVRGLVVAVLPGGGWLIRALPILLAGAGVTLVAALLLRRPDLRAAAITIGGSLTVSTIGLVLRPFVNAVLLAATTTSHGSVATVISTGLLPVRVASSGGAHIDLVSGQLGVLRSPAVGDRVDLTVALHLPPLGWAVVVAVCGLPLLVPVSAAIRSRIR